MKAGKILGWIDLVILACAVGWAQDTHTANDWRRSGVAIPRLVRFNGIANDESGEPMHGVVGITFALYRERDGGAPLWLETQNVELDGKGHYAVLLGASKADGLPSDLFMSGEARWLGVQAERQPEQLRLLLVSVPYALKAADAETVGGKPPSAFVLAAPAGDASKTGQAAAPSTIAAISGSGTTNFIPIWKSSTTLGNSTLFQSGSKVGIGTTTPNANLESVVASEGTLAFRLDSGPNSFLDITPTNAGGRFQTKVSTVNNRDLIFLPGTGNVGINTTTPANTLEVVAGGTTLADAWTVRSSRCLKTNVQPLEGALEKVEQLQGVSYDRKSDGRHEIGVIAEDVDQVLPEVVSRDPRTKEVQGVDYARLAALLIEAVKSQQAEIQQLKVQIEQVISSSAYGQ